MAGEKKVFQYDGRILVLEDPLAYRHEVERYLNLIATTYTGRLLFRYINMRYRHVLIIPYVPAHNPDGYINAAASADDFKGAYGSGMPINGVWTIPGYGKITIPTWVGTGHGSTVTLKFHPAIFRQLNANQGYIAAGAGPGEILFHEMIHALRQVYGVMMDVPIVEDRAMDNFEEFCAVSASNVYRSERGFHVLRSNHEGFTALKTAETDPELYAQKFAKHLERWFGQQRSFCLEMAASQAKFNPFKFTAYSLGLSPPTPMALSK